MYMYNVHVCIILDVNIACINPSIYMYIRIIWQLFYMYECVCYCHASSKETAMVKISVIAVLC